MRKEERWIGVDLDGTLAHFDWERWVAEGYSYIGPPVLRMLVRVRRWIAGGHKIKIFTARITDNPEIAIPHIREWLSRWGLPRDLEITNVKDWLMDELWDDRCVQVERNTGKRVGNVEVPRFKEEE